MSRVGFIPRQDGNTATAAAKALHTSLLVLPSGGFSAIIIAIGPLIVNQRRRVCALSSGGRGLTEAYGSAFAQQGAEQKIHSELVHL